LFTGRVLAVAIISACRLAFEEIRHVPVNVWLSVTNKAMIAPESRRGRVHYVESDDGRSCGTPPPPLPPPPPPHPPPVVGATVSGAAV